MPSGVEKIGSLYVWLRRTNGYWCLRIINNDHAGQDYLGTERGVDIGLGWWGLRITHFQEDSDE